MTKHQSETDVYLPNLKGFLVGNGVTNWKYDGTPAYFHLSRYFGLIDDETYFKAQKNCDWSYYDVDDSSISVECQGYM